MSEMGATYRTGEKCDTSGNYVFLQYADGAPRPSPAQNERVITLNKGTTFPPIASTGASAVWKLQRPA